jgi:hypothetical protein
VGGLAVERAHQRGIARQVLDEDAQAPGGQPAAEMVQEIHSVVAEQVGLDRLGVLGQELVEAEDSPRDIPVPLP